MLLLLLLLSSQVKSEAVYIDDSERQYLSRTTLWSRQPPYTLCTVLFFFDKCLLLSLLGLTCLSCKPGQLPISSVSWRGIVSKLLLKGLRSAAEATTAVCTAHSLQLDSSGSTLWCGHGLLLVLVCQSTTCRPQHWASATALCTAA